MITSFPVPPAPSTNKIGCNLINDVQGVQQPIVFVEGAGGTGKSYFFSCIQTISDASQNMSATPGVSLDHKTSVCSMYVGYVCSK